MDVGLESMHVVVQSVSRGQEIRSNAILAGNSNHIMCILFSEA